MKTTSSLPAWIRSFQDRSGYHMGTWSMHEPCLVGKPPIRRFETYSILRDIKTKAVFEILSSDTG